MTKLRLVIDTNILISGLMSVNSLPQQVFDIITGDTDLLDLHPFQNISIIKAANFLTAVKIVNSLPPLNER